MTTRFRLFNSFFMSMVLSFFMTAWITYINLGVVENCVGLWMKAWGLAWPAAFLIAFVSGPYVMKLSKKLAN